MTTPRAEEEANRIRSIVRYLAQLLPDKARAYGDAHSRQLALWQLLLAPYQQGDGSYHIPAAMLDHIPRLTRVFDRVFRIVDNPEEDYLGETPWLDMAGDAIAGVSMPRTGKGKLSLGELLPTCQETPGCEARAGHAGPCRKVHAGGLVTMPPGADEPNERSQWVGGEPADLVADAEA